MDGQLPYLGSVVDRIKYLSYWFCKVGKVPYLRLFSYTVLLSSTAHVIFATILILSSF